MKEKFYKINLSKLPENYKEELLGIKTDTENFGDPDLVSIEQDNFNMLYSKIEKQYPDAISGSAPKKKAPKKKVKQVVKLGNSAKFKVGDWVMAKAFSSNAKGEVYEVVKSGSSFEYKLKDQYGNKDEKLFAESLLKKTTAPQKAPVTKSTNEIEGCKEVLEKAKYKVVKIKSNDGKKTMTSKKKRQDRTIIKDRVESTFIPIEKDISGSKEKDEKFKEAQKFVTIIKNALTMIMQGIDKLATDNNVEALSTIAGLFQKITGQKVLKMEKGDNIAIDNLNKTTDKRNKMVSFIVAENARKSANSNSDAWWDKEEKRISLKSFANLKKEYIRLGGTEEFAKGGNVDDDIESSFSKGDIYTVSIDYQDEEGEPQTENIDVIIDDPENFMDEDDVVDHAQSIFKKNFKYMKIDGGDIWKKNAKGGRTKRTKDQILHDKYCSEVDKYNWYIIELDSNDVISGYEYKTDAEEFRLDLDVDENGKDAKEHKTVSKKTLTQMGIKIPNEEWKKMGKGGNVSFNYDIGDHIKYTNVLSREKDKTDIGYITGYTRDGHRYIVYSRHNQRAVDPKNVIEKTPEKKKNFILFGKGGFLKGSKFYLIHTYIDEARLEEKVIGRDYTTDKFVKFQSDKKLQARKDQSLLGYYLLDPKTLETWHLKPMITGNYKVGEILSKFKQGGNVRDLGRDMRFLSKEKHEISYAPKRKRPFKKYKD